MPKMKTKRGARKRLKRTGSGKLKRAGGWKQHKLEGKDPRRADKRGRASRRTSRGWGPAVRGEPIKEFLCRR